MTFHILGQPMPGRLFFLPAAFRIARLFCLTLGVGAATFTWVTLPHIHFLWLLAAGVVAGLALDRVAASPLALTGTPRRHRLWGRVSIDR